MPKRPVNEREHAVGEVVFLKELSAAHLPSEEGIQIENSGAPVGGEHRLAGGAERFECHGIFREKLLFYLLIDIDNFEATVVGH